MNQIITQLEEKREAARLGGGQKRIDTQHAQRRFRRAAKQHHAEQPMHPHADQPCRVCHVESTLGHRARTEALMHEKLFDGEGSEP